MLFYENLTNILIYFPSAFSVEGFLFASHLHGRSEMDVQVKHKKSSCRAGHYLLSIEKALSLEPSLELNGFAMLWTISGQLFSFFPLLTDNFNVSYLGSFSYLQLLTF